MAEADRLDVREKAPLILAELLYDAEILTQIKKYRTLFLRVTMLAVFALPVEEHVACSWKRFNVSVHTRKPEGAEVSAGSVRKAV